MYYVQSFVFEVFFLIIYDMYITTLHISSTRSEIEFDVECL